MQKNSISKKIFVTVTLLMLLLGASMMVGLNAAVVQNEVAVEVGDAFTFVVSRYSLSLTQNAETVSADQFTINGSNPTNPGPDAKFTITIKEISGGFFGTTLTYEVQVGSSKVNATSSIFSALFIMLYGYVPFFYLTLVTSGGKFTTSDINTDIEDFLPYAFPVNGSQDQLWDTLAQSFENQSTTKKDDDSNLKFETKSSRNDGNFEGYINMEGIAKNQTTDDSLTFNSKMRIVYEMSTGVLQGFKTESNIEGVINGSEMKIITDVEIEREGYEIEGFGGGLLGLGIPGFGPTMALLALLVGIGVVSFQKKKYKK